MAITSLICLLLVAVPSDPTFRGCVLSTQKNVLFVVFVLIMAFETCASSTFEFSFARLTDSVILVLTLVKGLEHCEWVPIGFTHGP